MLIDMTIANFKSVKDPQTISYEALRDKRFDESKTYRVNSRLNLIKCAAIIGPNGAGKSTFVRALEALKAVLTADDSVENPLVALARTEFAYSESTKNDPCTISIRVLLDKETDEHPATIGEYVFRATPQKIFYESLYFVFGTSRKIMFERQMLDDGSYRFKWGKMYRGEKKRVEKVLPCNRTFLAEAAKKDGETAMKMYSWFTDTMHILPMGVSSLTEKYIIEKLKEHPDWVTQLKNFLWSIDITDIRDVVIKQFVKNGHAEEKLVFVHTNVTMHYASLFDTESLSLRRLTLMAISFFESFVTGKFLVIDDFGMLLHPDVLAHIVEIFDAGASGTGSQMLAVDCNPSLLVPGLMRRDGIYFAEKSAESSTRYFSLAEFKYSKNNDLTYQKYLSGAFGSLPILSEFCFVDAGEEK